MSDIGKNGATLDRRQATKLMMMVSGGVALAPFLGGCAGVSGQTVGTTGAPAFKTGGDELMAFMKLQTRADDGYTEYVNSGTVYGAVSGRPSVPMYGYEGLLRFHTRVVGPNIYDVTFIEAGTYLDLRTRERVDRFKNPITGLENAVEHIVEGPMTWHWTADSLQIKEPAPIVHRRVEWQHFSGESWLYFDNIITGGGFGNPAALSTFTGSTAQLFDKSRNRVDNTMLMDSSINPWAPWLKMGDAPGRLATSVIGRKLSAMSEVPDRLTKYIAAHHPKVLEGVESWATVR